jgi:hypothetical protein
MLGHFANDIANRAITRSAISISMCPASDKTTRTYLYSHDNLNYIKITLPFDF